MHLDAEKEFTSNLIRRITRRMVGRGGITNDEIPDLGQDLWLDLLERQPHYRSERGSPRAFITLVLKNRASSIIKSRLAHKRGHGVPCLSLNWESQDVDGEPEELLNTISVDDYFRLTRGPVRSEEERMDLALDVSDFITKLPPSERVVCLLLVERGATDIAGVVGIPRSTLRSLIERLRNASDWYGLEDYRQCARRFRPDSGK